MLKNIQELRKALANKTPTQNSTSSNLTTTIKVQEVFGEDKLNKNGKPYTMVNVIYRNDKNQLKEKKSPHFTDQGKLIINTIEEGKEFNVTMVKGEDGFWTWIAISPA